MRWLAHLTHRQYLFAYGSQLIGVLTALSFNLILPLQVGVTTYGGFVAAFSLSFSVFAIFAPGYSLAAVRHLASFGSTPRDSLLLLRWLMIPGFVGFASVILLGVLGVFAWPLIMSICAAGLVPVLSTTHLLDCLLVAQDRNERSLYGRLAVGIGVALIPWMLAKIVNSPTSVLLGVLMAYLVSAGVYAQLLAIAKVEPNPTEGRQLQRFPGLFSSSVHYSAVSMTSTLFGWAILLIMSWRLGPDQLAGLKIAFAVSTALVAILPLPQMYIFARLQSAILRSSSDNRIGILILGVAIGMGVFAALILHLWGPAAISLVYGPSFAAAAGYVRMLAWLVIPQLVEQPLLAVLSTVHSANRMTPYYAVGLAASLAVPALAITILGADAIAAAIVIARIVSIAVPALLLIRQPHPNDHC